MLLHVSVRMLGNVGDHKLLCVWGSPESGPKAGAQVARSSGSMWAYRPELGIIALAGDYIIASPRALQELMGADGFARGFAAARVMGSFVGKPAW